MRSPKSEISRVNEGPLALDLKLPVFTEEPREHWPLPMTWSQAMRQLAAAREQARKFDSPEARLRAKNPNRFSLD